MAQNTIVFTVFLIFTGAAVLSTLALYTRQSLLVAYILLGVLLGPTGLGWVSDSALVKQVGNVGIIFLLFLLGLHLHPQNLFKMLQKATWVTLISALLFMTFGFGISYYFGFTSAESAIIGACLVFSSTIIALKLLPTTVLHHQHIGELMISILLMQDFLAIVMLLLLEGAKTGAGLEWLELVWLVLALPGLTLFAFLMHYFVLVKLLRRFDKTQEYVFLLSIGWCLAMSELAGVLGLSHEMGAFIAGVALAASPIALFVAESLKPLRDFFLVMFFFSVGAGFDLRVLPQVMVPAIVMGICVLTLKPLIFRFLLQRSGEKNPIAQEVGIRLGQASEFSLLLAGFAVGTAFFGQRALYLVQATTIFTFIASSYVVVLRYQTPIALFDRMRRD